MGTLRAIGHPGSRRTEAPIESKKIWILALGAAALATLAKIGDGAPAAPIAAPPSFVTRCAVVETGSVDGFVSNQASEPYRLRGEVRFVFTSGGVPSRPERLVQGDVELPPGKAVRVARAILDAPLRNGEECRLIVEKALVRE